MYLSYVLLIMRGCIAQIDVRKRLKIRFASQSLYLCSSGPLDDSRRTESQMTRSMSPSPLGS